MPQSLSCVSLHLVFSTKNRQPFLRDPILRQEMHAYLGRTSKTLECPPLIVGGVEDHVHLLGRMSRTITQADWVKELKRVSSIWIKQRDPGSTGTGTIASCKKGDFREARSGSLRLEFLRPEIKFC